MIKIINKKRDAKILTFMTIGIVIFIILNKLYNPTGSTGEWYTSYIITDYYKKTNNTVDTLYVGSSNIYAGVSPLEIYQNIGVTGYDYSTPEQKVWSSYYLLKEAYKTQKPKIVFLETSEFFSNISEQNEQSMRKAIEPIKLSKDKIEMINSKAYNFSNFDKLSCYIPILRYHSRWQSLTSGDFSKFWSKKQLSYDGYVFNSNVQSYQSKVTKINDDNDDDNIDITDIYKMPVAVREYLSKIIELCNDNNSELVLISMPAPKIWSQEKHDDVTAFAETNNLKFIDLNAEESLNIDWTEDSPDVGIHLNIYGAEKVGTFLTNYINQNWNMKDHRNDEEYSEWNCDLDRYNIRKEKVKNK